MKIRNSLILAIAAIMPMAALASAQQGDKMNDMNHHGMMLTSSSSDWDKVQYLETNEDVLSGGDRYELMSLLNASSPSHERLLEKIIGKSRAADLAVKFSDASMPTSTFTTAGDKTTTSGDKMAGDTDMRATDVESGNMWMGYGTKTFDDINASLDGSERGQLASWWSDASWKDQDLILRIWRGGQLRHAHAHYYNNF